MSYLCVLVDAEGFPESEVVDERLNLETEVRKR